MEEKSPLSLEKVILNIKDLPLAQWKKEIDDLLVKPKIYDRSGKFIRTGHVQFYKRTSCEVGFDSIDQEYISAVQAQKNGTGNEIEAVEYLSFILDSLHDLQSLIIGYSQARVDCGKLNTLMKDAYKSFRAFREYLHTRSDPRIKEMNNQIFQYVIATCIKILVENRVVLESPLYVREDEYVNYDTGKLDLSFGNIPFIPQNFEAPNKTTIDQFFHLSHYNRKTQQAKGSLKSGIAIGLVALIFIGFTIFFLTAGTGALTKLIILSVFAALTAITCGAMCVAFFLERQSLLKNAGKPPIELINEHLQELSRSFSSPPSSNAIVSSLGGVDTDKSENKNVASIESSSSPTPAASVENLVSSFTPPVSSNSSESSQKPPLDLTPPSKLNKEGR